MAPSIYLDNNATTRPLPEVVEAMLPLLREDYANPSSLHHPGQLVRHRIDQARQQMAAAIGAHPREIIFTSGGTESVNLAIRGRLNATPTRRRILVSAVEHSAVRRLAEELRLEGYPVDTVGVDQQGNLRLDELESKLTDDTSLVSLLLANNETGVLFDIRAAAAIADAKGVPLHVDAVQGFGKVPLDVRDWPIALMSLSGHKFHGPKGVGALYVRKQMRLQPLAFGGSQERDLRAGTENVPGIVGMGVAAEAAATTGLAAMTQVAAMRDALEQGISAAIPTARIHGAGAARVANTTNIAFQDVQGEAILILLSERGVCASSGAACSSGSLEPSHVLQAMKADPRYIPGAIRFSLCRLNTPDEVRRVVDLMPEVISRLTAIAAP
jgi:cysteine desulfurase